MRGREEGGERKVLSDYVKIVSATLWIETKKAKLM